MKPHVAVTRTSNKIVAESEAVFAYDLPSFILVIVVDLAVSAFNIMNCMLTGGL